MTDDSIASALAETVTPLGVHAYLAAHGWMRTGSYRSDRGGVYRRRDDRETVLVPASNRFADYPIRILELAEVVGRTEDRRPSMVLADLSLATVDLIRVRLPIAHDDYSIALNAGVDLLDGARRLLLAAACSTVRPQRQFRAGRNERAASYLDGVRLGQTAPGSFIVNLQIPVSPALAEADQNHLFEPPFERRANRTLVAGLRAVREATDLVNRGEGDIWAFDARVQSGVSANLCTAAAELIGIGGGLEVCVSWALTRPQNEEHDEQRSTVRFQSPDALVLTEAARILSSQQERVDERIEGYVSALARDQTEPDGRATIKAVIDGALTSVKADFSPSEYNKITTAHANRLTVSLEGDLRREGQRWHLANPRDLTVVADDQ